MCIFKSDNTNEIAKSKKDLKNGKNYILHECRLACNKYYT